MLFTNQCDDGNMIDGDGCSHNCTVEVMYQCTKSSPSLCKYFGIKIAITVIDIQKQDYENRGIFTFTFQPKLINLAKVNISNYFNFYTSSASYQVTNWVYSNGTVTVYVDYQTAL